MAGHRANREVAFSYRHPARRSRRHALERTRHREEDLDVAGDTDEEQDPHERFRFAMTPSRSSTDCPASKGESKMLVARSAFVASTCVLDDGDDDRQRIRAGPRPRLTPRSSSSGGRRRKPRRRSERASRRQSVRTLHDLRRTVATNFQGLASSLRSQRWCLTTCPAVGRGSWAPASRLGGRKARGLRRMGPAARRDRRRRPAFECRRICQGAGTMQSETGSGLRCSRFSASVQHAASSTGNSINFRASLRAASHLVPMAEDMHIAFDYRKALH